MVLPYANAFWDRKYATTFWNVHKSFQLFMNSEHCPGTRGYCARFVYIHVVLAFLPCAMGRCAPPFWHFHSLLVSFVIYFFYSFQRKYFVCIAANHWTLGAQVQGTLLGRYCPWLLLTAWFHWDNRYFSAECRYSSMPFIKPRFSHIYSYAYMWAH